MYSLVGPDYTVDTDAKSVTGSLVAQGVDTGVDVEVRPGRPERRLPAGPGAHVPRRGRSLLGAVTTDAAIAAAADQPTVAVASQMTVEPADPDVGPGEPPGAEDHRARSPPTATPS